MFRKILIYSENSAVVRKILWNSEKLWNIPKTFEIFRNVFKNSENFRKFQKYSDIFRNGQKNQKNFEKKPRKIFLKNQKNFEKKSEKILQNYEEFWKIMKCLLKLWNIEKNSKNPEKIKKRLK